jgi:hypothetical protein
MSTVGQAVRLQAQMRLLPFHGCLEWRLAHGYAPRLVATAGADGTDPSQ